MGRAPASLAFASGALLMALEMLAARLLVPRLGGVPAAFNTCAVFFQLTLLGGYAYAHAGARRLGPRRRAALHLALALAAAASLPFGAHVAAVADVAHAVRWIAGALAVGFVLPMLVLSATTPLLAALGTPAAAGRVFAAGNAGALLGLIGYPLLLERALGLSAQGIACTGAYLAVALGVGALAWRAGKINLGESSAGANPSKSRPSSDPGGPTKINLGGLALAAAPAALLPSVTAFVSADLASLPLVWMPPLALYFASFAWAFAGRPRVPRALFALRGLALAPIAWSFLAPPQGPSAALMLAHLGGFFVLATVCHAALAARLPHGETTRGLLEITAGGALGGLLAVLVAPLVFPNVEEYPLAALVACLLGAAPAAARARRVERLVPAALALGLGAAVLTGSLRDRPLARARSFFGVLRVTEDASGRYHTLWHGTTMHGMQARGATHREPLAYYHRQGPAGDAFAVADRLGLATDVSLVGLGTGALAAYAQPGATWRFIEIDPAMFHLAQHPLLFTHVRDSLAQTSVVMGDGRSVLAGEGDARHGVIVLDAFGGDAVPTHLLTREAVALYASHLAPGGFLLVHTSSRFFDLDRPLAAAARDLGLHALAAVDPGDPRHGRWSSRWMVLTAAAATRDAFAALPRWRAPALPAGAHAFTDDHADLIGALR